MTLNSSLYVLLCPPLYAYHYLRKFQLTSIIQLAFLQPFQHHILPHLQSLLHRVFTVNLLRGISGLKPASCFLCTVNKAQTFHEAREASGSILWLFAMPFTHQALAGLRLAVPEVLTPLVLTHQVQTSHEAWRISLLLFDNLPLFFKCSMNNQHLVQSLLVSRS